MVVATGVFTMIVPCGGRPVMTAPGFPPVSLVASVNVRGTASLNAQEISLKTVSRILMGAIIGLPMITALIMDRFVNRMVSPLSAPTTVLTNVRPMNTPALGTNCGSAQRIRTVVSPSFSMTTAPPGGSPVMTMALWITVVDPLPWGGERMRR